MQGREHPALLQLHTSAQPAAQILFTALSFEFCTPVTSWSCPKGEEKICYKCRVFSAQPFIWRNIMRSTRCSRWNVLADKQNRKVICNSAASAQMPSVALSTMVRGRLLMLMRRFATGADLFNLIQSDNVAMDPEICVHRFTGGLARVPSDDVTMAKSQGCCQSKGEG